MDTQKITSEKQTNTTITETEQFQNITNEKQESYQQEKLQRKNSEGYQQAFPTSQFIILDRPITDRPISNSNVLEEKITLPSKPIERKYR